MAKKSYIAGFHPDTLKAPSVPTFVSIVQPGYIWSEYEHGSDHVGRTGLPKTKRTKEAVLIAPAPRSPETASVRIHELLHAKWTPQINQIANKLLKSGLSTHAINIAEDHRIHFLGAKIKAFETVGASIDVETAIKYLERALYDVEATRQTGFDMYRPVTTGTVVHASLALSSYPFRCGFDATKLEQVIGCLPASAPLVADVALAEALIAEFNERRAEIFARVWKGKKAEANRFGALAELVEEILLRAFDDELSKEKKPQGGTGDGEAGKGEASEASQGGTQAEGGSGEGEGSDAADKPWDAEDGDGKGGSEDEAEAEPKSAKSGEGEGKSGPKAKTEPKRSRLFEARIESNPVKVGASEVEKERLRKETIETINRNRELAARGVQPEEKGGLRHLHMRTPEGQNDTGPSTVSKFEDLASVKLSLSTDCAKDGWGPMDINTPLLARPRRHLAPRMGRASLDGSMPRHYGRWFVDRAIMDAKGRRPGGTLLIDVSGSMGWADATTRLLLDVCPAMTLAVYSSKSTSRSEGHLTILAKDGKLVPQGFEWRYEIGHGGGNVVDGPALAWLIKQPGPRVWYSDGMVTGSGESVKVSLFIDANRLALLGNVTRTVSVERTMGILSGKERPDPLGGNILSELLKAKREGNTELTNDLRAKMFERDTADKTRDREAKDRGTSYAKVLGLVAA